MTTVLLTLGRLPKALDLARGFARLGCRVIVAEPFAWHLARVSRAVAACHVVPAPRDDPQAYLAALTRIVEIENVDLVVPVSEEIVHVAFLAAMLPARCRLFAMPAASVLTFYDKAGFAATARDLGLAVPETHRLGSLAGRRLVQSSEVVVKPRFSCSGRGVQILTRGSRLPETVADDPAIVQAFVAGRSYSSCSLAQAGVVRATVVYRGLVMSGSVAVAFERVDDQPAIVAWIERFVRATRWSGFIAFDFIVDDAGRLFAIECNPRTTSGVHFWVAEDIAAAILEPDRAAPMRLRPQRRLQQFYACWTETLAALVRGRGVVERAGHLLRARDVTWDIRDPLPFLTMTFTSWRIIEQSIVERTTFGQVATRDIAWRDGDFSAAAGATDLRDGPETTPPETRRPTAIRHR